MMPFIMARGIMEKYLENKIKRLTSDIGKMPLYASGFKPNHV
jgi:hypothetical protein